MRDHLPLAEAIGRQVGFHSDKRDTSLGILTFVPGSRSSGKRFAAPGLVRMRGQSLLLRLRGGASTAKEPRVQVPKEKSTRGRKLKSTQRYVPVLSGSGSGGGGSSSGSPSANAKKGAINKRRTSFSSSFNAEERRAEQQAHFATATRRGGV